MAISEVVRFKEASDLLVEYKRCFKIRYGNEPIIDDEGAAMVDMRWICGTFGAEKAKLLVRAYLRLDDQWLSQQAYPLRFIRKNINKVLASDGVGGIIERDKYLVAFTESGVPVFDTNPNILKDTPHYREPIPMEDFLQK